jgi:hypothetical protein
LRTSSKGACSSLVVVGAEAADASMKEFSYDEVEAATGGFAAKNLVGKGSHGSVYRAKLRGGGGGGGRMVVVAVKRPSHGQGEAKLAKEIAVLSAAPRHPGVVGIVVSAPPLAAAAEEFCVPKFWFGKV